MRHRPLRRIAAALVNLLFLLAWGEPVALHPCPMHDGVAATATTATSATAMHSTASHHGHMAMAPSTGHDHAAHEGGHVCSCLGSCSVSVGAVAPSAQAIRWQVVVRRRVAPIEADAAAPLASAPRLLPFANGPPRTA